MLLETGTGTGVRPQSPGPIFLSKMAQLEAFKRPITATLAPIEYITPLLEAAAIEYATRLDFRRETDLSGELGLEALPVVIGYQSKTQRLEAIIQNLSNGLSTAEWSQGPSTRAEHLLQEYIILLQSNKSLSQYTKDIIQQRSSLQSIEETKKGLQQTDSVRRLANFDIFGTKKISLKETS